MKLGSTTGGTTVIVVVALLVGVLLGGGVGYVVSANRQADQDQALLASAKPTAPAPNPEATETEADRLRTMLAEKETAYAKLREENEQLKKQPESPVRLSASASTNSFGGRGGGEGFMDRLRRDDPERVKQWEQEREQRRQQTEARYQESLAKLQARRQAAQTAEEKELLDQLSASTTKLHDVGEAWQAMGSATGTNRMEQFRQLAEQSRDAYQAHAELRTKDRQLQLTQLATQAGYKDPAQAKQFADAVQKIYDETDASPGRMIGTALGFSRGRGGRGETPSVVITPQ